LGAGLDENFPEGWIAMSEAVQYLLSGLAMGSIYSLVGLGFCIMWATSETVNFANGDSVMFGAVLGVTFCVDLGLPIWMGVIIILMLSACLGVVIERFAIRPFRGVSAIGWMLSTIAIGIILRNIVMVTFGLYDRPFPTPWVEEPLRIFGAGIYPQEIMIPIVALVLMIVVDLFYNKTKFGSGLRAVSFNREAAALMGINVNYMIVFSYALATSVAGFAGFIIAPVILASSHMGLLIGLKGFSVAIIGGITSPRGTILAGFIFGIVEYMIAGYFSTAAREITAFSIVILILLIRPSGIFGGRSREA
jgi:branched-chain amino acid transport system permease protein